LLAILLPLLPDGCHFADNTKFNYNWQQKQQQQHSSGKKENESRA